MEIVCDAIQKSMADIQIHLYEINKKLHQNVAGLSSIVKSKQKTSNNVPITYSY